MIDHAATPDSSGSSDRADRHVWRRLLVGFLLGVALLGGAPRLANGLPRGRATLAVDAGRGGPVINPAEFGAFMEEISHSGDGGLYDELIRNRDLKEDPNAPLYWSQYTSSGSTASIRLDSTQPRNAANPVSLALSIGTITRNGGSAGVFNTGYWGIPVRPSTTYRVSFFAKSSRQVSGPLKVSLDSVLEGTVWAITTIRGVTDHWARYTATIRTSSDTPTSLDNRLLITTGTPSDSGSTIWFTLVSLFPPTYEHLANGFRIDLMQKIAALHPGYLRIPGGDYEEGATIATRFDWKQTIGPIADRPGHDNTAWGYWSQDGLGLLEWLELAQEVHAQPLLSVYAGYSLNGTVVPRAELGPYVQDALDEIQYAIGPVRSFWGAQRAADGHPAPFPVNMVEIGNEDNFDLSGGYDSYRYPMFYDAIKAAYPRLRIVATAPVTSRPMDVLDEHFYVDIPSFFAQSAHLFDHASRRGPKILVGEYAAVQGSPTGTLAAGLGEAAFLTGIERNADLVIGASYAPLLVNMNAPNWPTSLIGYDGLESYGSPSYWVLKMFADGHGRRVIGSRLDGAPGNVFDLATHSPGHTYLVIVNDGGAAQPTLIRLRGLRGGAHGGTASVLTGDPTTMNSLTAPSAVTPSVHFLPELGVTFDYTFPADSLTVLDLRTA
jgi:alpha-L-arabinofuranosidase